MEVALITVGEELLSGDTVDTNANWLGGRLSDRGVTVARILTLPDDQGTIADAVRQFAEVFDAVVVTGGIGGTPDDRTMEAVADAFDREMVVSPVARSGVERRLAELDARIPDVDVDVEAEASVPAGSRPLVNPVGLAPGCVLENVYVFPGIPEELKAMFATVADEFDGDRRSRYLYTVEPEANLVWALRAVPDRFPVSIGCYPDREARHNRLKLTATADEPLEAAADWLLENVDVSETPVSRDWGPRTEEEDDD